MTEIIHQTKYDDRAIITQEGGAVVASVLSLYDVPKEYGSPKYVSMEVANTVVQAGIPSSARQSNDDKFASVKFITQSKKDQIDGKYLVRILLKPFFKDKRHGRYGCLPSPFIFGRK